MSSLFKKTDLIKVAKVSKPHGIKGEIFIQASHPQFDWPQFQEIIIEDKNFEILSSSKHKQGMILSLKSISSKEQAEGLRGKEVFLKKELFQTQDSKFIYMLELQGFEVFDGEKFIGKVSSFQSSKTQDFLLVKREEKEILIPFLKSYIKETNFEKKTLNLNLPEDFLDVF